MPNLNVKLYLPQFICKIAVNRTKLKRDLYALLPFKHAEFIFWKPKMPNFNVKLYKPQFICKIAVK